MGYGKKASELCAAMAEKARLLEAGITQQSDSILSEQPTSFETPYISEDKTYYTNNVILRHINVHERIINSIKKAYKNGSLPKEDWKALHDHLKTHFNCWTAGRLIKNYGVLNIIEAMEITIEQINYRDKSRQPVADSNKFFMGVLFNISRRDFVS